jgi:hypothetical protein
MTGSRQCPEDLLALARDGSPGFRDDPEVTNHLKQCRNCRREWAMGRAFQLEFSECTDVDGLAARVTGKVISRLAGDASGAPPSPERPGGPKGESLLTTLPIHPRKASRTLVYLLAAALVLASITAYATMQPIARNLWRSLLPAYGPPPAASTAKGSPHPFAVPDPAALATVAGEEAPVEVPKEVPTGSPQAAPRGAPKTADATPTAHELFASANLARHDNNVGQASALYHELQRRYPASTEALVSRVSLGRLLLDRLHDPAGALAQFDRYLSERAPDSLAEEALFGRASALAALNRLDAERETWRTLLARYPNSIYADRAHARLEGGQ